MRFVFFFFFSKEIMYFSELQDTASKIPVNNLVIYIDSVCVCVCMCVCVCVCVCVCLCVCVCDFSHV